MALPYSWPMIAIPFPDFVLPEPNGGFGDHESDCKMSPPLVGTHHANAPIIEMMRSRGMNLPAFGPDFGEAKGIVVEFNSQPVSIAALGIQSALGGDDTATSRKKSKRWEHAQFLLFACPAVS